MRNQIRIVIYVGYYQVIIRGDIMNSIIRMCPLCRKRVILEMTNEEKRLYVQKDRQLIQDVLPNMDIFKREFLISGYCGFCQELLFGKKFVITKEWKIE